MNVVVVGGSGRVGSMVVPHLEASHRVTIFDVRAPAYENSAAYRQGRLDDTAAVEEVLKSADAIVYMAMGQLDGWNQTSEWVASHFDVNVKWLWLVLDIAKRAGVRRLVHLSTMSVFDDYLRSGSYANARPDARDVYGFTKYVGELVCAANGSPISTVSLRLVGPMADTEWVAFADASLESVVTAGTDVAAAVAAALTVQLEPGQHEAIAISGDWRGERVNIDRARQLLGWEPLARRSPAE